MIQKINKQFQILESEFKRMNKMIQTFVLDSPLFSSYIGVIKSVTLITSNICTSFKEMLSPQQYNVISRTYNAVANELMDRIKQIYGFYQQIKAQKETNIAKINTQICTICGQNIHESNIKQTMLTLQENKRQQFQLVIEQFKKISEEPLFSQKENSQFQQLLHFQLSQRQRILNVNCNRIEEFVGLMDSTLADLTKLKQLQFNQNTQSLPQYTNPIKINEDVSTFLKHSFSQKIPQWIQKMFGKMVSSYIEQCNLKKTETGMQTASQPPPQNYQLKECMKEKKALQKENKQLNDQLKQLRDIKVCYKKLQQINREYADTIAKMAVTAKKSRLSTLKEKQKHRKNSLQQDNKSSIKIQMKDQDQQSNLNSSILDDDMHNSATNTPRRRKVKKSSIFPRIRNNKYDNRLTNTTVLHNDYSVMLKKQNQLNMNSSLNFTQKVQNTKYEASIYGKAKSPRKMDIQEQKQDLVQKQNKKPEDKNEGNQKVPKSNAKGVKRYRQRNSETIEIERKENKANSLAPVYKKERKESNSKIQYKIKKVSKNKMENINFGHGNNGKQFNIPPISSKNSSIITSQQQTEEAGKSVLISEHLEQSVQLDQNEKELIEQKQIEKVPADLSLAAYNENHYFHQLKIMRKISQNLSNKITSKRQSIQQELGDKANKVIERGSIFKPTQKPEQISNTKGQQKSDSIAVKQVAKENQLKPKNGILTIQKKKQYRKSEHISPNLKIVKNNQIGHKAQKSHHPIISQVKENVKFIRKTVTQQEEHSAAGVFISEKAQLKTFEILKKSNALPNAINYNTFLSLVEKAELDLLQNVPQQQNRNQTQNKQASGDQAYNPSFADLAQHSVYGRLFLNKAVAYKYEQSMAISYHKKIIKELNHHQLDFCYQIYTNLCEMRKKDCQIYTQFCSILRYPYQTLYNNIQVVNFVSEMTFDTFEYFFRKIAWIHRHCPKAQHSGVCEHIQSINQELKQLLNKQL